MSQMPQNAHGTHFPIPPGDWPDRVWDVIVVGAGPAGSMIAYELSRLGKKALLLDRRAFPRWKVCGATLNHGCQAVLDRAGLGDLLETSGARSLDTLHLGGWAHDVEVPLDGTVALSRVIFDSALIRAATEAGALFLQETVVKPGRLVEGGRTLLVGIGDNQVEITGKIVIAADGLSSGLMAGAGVPSKPLHSGKRPLIGLGAVLPVQTPGFPAGVIHMAVGNEGYVGFVRVEDGSLNAAAAVSPSALRAAESPTSLINSLLRQAGWLEIEEASDLSWTGTPELTRSPSRPGAERLFAVGDAGGYVEPFTGEGMYWALAGASLLAPLAVLGTEEWTTSLLDDWTALQARLIGRAQRLCQASAWVLARPPLARLSIRVLEASPRLARGLVRRVGAPILT